MYNNTRLPRPACDDSHPPSMWPCLVPHKSLLPWGWATCRSCATPTQQLAGGAPARQDGEQLRPGSCTAHEAVCVQAGALGIGGGVPRAHCTQSVSYSLLGSSDERLKKPAICGSSMSLYVSASHHLSRPSLAVVTWCWWANEPLFSHPELSEFLLSIAYCLFAHPDT